MDKDDFYKGDETNLPSLALELQLDGVGIQTLEADTTKNQISPLIDTYVINNPVYAKSTSRRHGGFSTGTASLGVRDLEIYKNVPSKVETPYKISEFREKFEGKGKVFLNIAEVFKSVKNLTIICDNFDILKKCSKQVRPQNIINLLFEQMEENGSASRIKSSISNDSITSFKENTLLSEALNIVEGLENVPFELKEENEKDLLLTAIQIIEVIKEMGSDIKKAKTYLEYAEIRKDIDYKLKIFNTTGRTIRTKETRNKLVIEFLAANKMSNGERDVLSFISNLSKFRVKFTKDIGVLIIDEIFDYLDGSNMLIVQYYLSKMIEDCRENGKVLFPIILTHLDPTLFNNYYFNRPKIHYLKNYSYTQDRTMLELLKIRSNKAHRELGDNLSKYYLHYHPEGFQFSASDKPLITNNDYHDSSIFYEMIHNETEKFLNGESYDPLKIICAIRVKIEKLVYDLLSTDEEKTKYIESHTTINKLNYAVGQGVNVPEDYFLLQPLYNDGLHLNNIDNATKNKILSTCLKLDNIVVQGIVRKIQSNEGSNLVLTHA
ncbi:hypothetical protein KM915_18440 [Cytobacillus oceanisediminis]|uniref:hypothetical protein n=1 Tax=Cytobacillus TaxID=2675230 RepID=UPI001C23C49C|nr:MULTISPECIES: hypothetical protein [Cytobacillus]MBU8732036.1 hypothetical protein [Cytobacillus oceanisediminis]WHY35403.1 hypothetical protein QNH44_06600 [Cytobacillus firmus]